MAEHSLDQPRGCLDLPGARRTLYLVCFLLGFYLILIFSRSFAFLWRCLRCGRAASAMYTDTAYTAYLSGFYSEPTALAL